MVDAFDTIFVSFLTILAGLLAVASTVPAFAVAHPFVPIDCPGRDGADPTITLPEASKACDHLFGGSIVID